MSESEDACRQAPCSHADSPEAILTHNVISGCESRNTARKHRIAHEKAACLSPKLTPITFLPQGRRKWEADTTSSSRTLAYSSLRPRKHVTDTMSYASAAAFLGITGILGVTLWGLFTRRQSAVFGVTAALFAFITGLGAWYSWAEPPQSVAWTTGYGLACLLGCATANRHLRRKASSKR